MRICLVSMPFPNLERPSPALGSLQASCEQAGHHVTCLYECHDFAELLGLPAYLSISREIINQLGEWIFLPSAFPGAYPDVDAYYELLNSDLCRHAFAHAANTGGEQKALGRNALREYRELAPRYVESAADRILALHPDVVGCTSQFQQHNASLALLRKVKAASPGMTTIMGGSNCVSTLGRITKKYAPFVDFVFSGEAEETLPAVLAQLSTHRALPLQQLPSGVWTDASVSNPTLPDVSHVACLDTLPTPNYRDYFERWNRFAYKDQFVPQVPFETSRGCWWYEQSGGCTFCSMCPNLKSFRSKSPDRVLTLITTLAEQTGIPYFIATDDILDKKYYDTLLPLLKERMSGKIAVFFEVKTNLTENQIQLLSEAGICWVQPGIESLSDGALKHMNKGATALMQIAFLKFCIENGIRTTWHILAGFPGDEARWYDEILMTLPYIEHLQPPDALIRLHLDRFSDYHQNAEVYGLKLVPHPVYAHTFPFSPEDMRDFAFFFTDVSGRTADPLTQSRIELVEAAVTKWNALFDLDGPKHEHPTLHLEDRGDSIVLTDTRPSAVAPQHLLAGLDALIYRAARTPVSLRRVIAELHDAFPDEAEIRSRVQQMIAHRLMIQIGPRILSLATVDKNKRLPSLSRR